MLHVTSLQKAKGFGFRLCVCLFVCFEKNSKLVCQSLLTKILQGEGGKQVQLVNNKVKDLSD